MSAFMNKQNPQKNLSLSKAPEPTLLSDFAYEPPNEAAKTEWNETNGKLGLFSDILTRHGISQAIRRDREPIFPAMAAHGEFGHSIEQKYLGPQPQPSLSLSSD
jgi:hypothetical protein